MEKQEFHFQAGSTVNQTCLPNSRVFSSDMYKYFQIESNHNERRSSKPFPHHAAMVDRTGSEDDEKPAFIARKDTIGDSQYLP